MRVARRQERPFLRLEASSSHGVRLNWQLLPGFLMMPMNWSIWFTSIAARVVYGCRIISHEIQSPLLACHHTVLKRAVACSDTELRRKAVEELSTT